ncbi:RNA polymerase sigma factor [uncultured Parabacteroides sp.]|uniref:RNA polymerase sigma factor n=1 Tax=uncultured Parabacteroides sp. TaxID=512312 RepID=UPI00260E4EE9|nr:RNA polymerase sigma factor [uncultured Parabacteroides sp.]
MELYTDTYYIQRIQAGDMACFACLLDKYSRPIHSLILKVVRSREDAEELAQDTFMKVFKGLSSFKGDCSFSTWIYRIAYNTAISSVRKKRHEFLTIEEATLENVSEEEVANLLGQTEVAEQTQRLETALGQLPPDERALILLFYWQEKSIEELASITGLTASNIKVKLHRIRKKLFALLKRMDHEQDEHK